MTIRTILRHLVTVMVKISSIIAIVVIISSSLVLSVYLRFELPDTISNVNIPNLSGHVTVTQDSFGFYHIVADTEANGLKAEGYLMARERLWQMDLYRREAEGNLAQIFYQYSPSFLDMDYSLRALGFYRIAAKDWQNFSIETQNFYQVFSDGINLFIQNNLNKLPIEFGILNYVPSLWSPLDTLAILKLMAFSLNAQGGGEPLIGNALSFVNQSTLLSFIRLAFDNNSITWSDPVAYPLSKIPITSPKSNVTNTTTTNTTSTNTTSTNTTSTNTITTNTTSTNTTTTKTTTTNTTSTNTTTTTNISTPVSYITRTSGLNLGNLAVQGTQSPILNFITSQFSFINSMESNSWVVSGNKTATGKPMLANEPHTSLESEGQWWFVDLTIYDSASKTTDFHITGETLPGIPGILIGRNDYIMWGFTNTGIDYLDTYVETFNNNYTQYLYNGTWLNTTIVPEKFYTSVTSYKMMDIYITNGTDNFTHGSRPVVPMYGANTTIRWTGQDSTSVAESLVLMIKSKSNQDFINALQLFNAPGQNVVWADYLGNIGLYVSGDIPIRNSGYGLAPHNGSIPTYEWKEFVPHNESYQIKNPADGFISIANNRVIPASYPYFLGYAFDNPYNVNRIDELLNVTSKISYNYMEDMQSDVYSLFAQTIVPKIIIPTSDPTIYAMENALQNWNYSYEVNSTQGPILELFTNYFLNLTFGDNLKINVLNQLPITGKLIENTLNLPQDSFWFNNTATKKNETKNDIIIEAYIAVKNYYQMHNLSINTFTWGQLHQVQFSHILGSKFNFLNAGGLEPSPGSKYTINIGSYNNNVNQAGSPSMRIIMGMDTNKTYLIILSPGESGLVGQNHYADQISRWLEGNYCLVVVEE